MPSQEISHDELSLLLFVYMGMGSDIMDLLVLFDENYVLNDDIAVYATLSVWTASLMQFTIVLTATSRSAQMARLDSQNGDYDRVNGKSKQSSCKCCVNEIWSICVTMFLQDAPFLAVRLYVIIKNATLSYTILFFTLKNLLMLMVQTYRLIVVRCCHTDPAKARVSMIPMESNPGTKYQQEENTVPYSVPSNNQIQDVPQ